MGAPLNVADVLDRAADLIEPEGAWTQFYWGDGEACFCMLGAMAHVAGADPIDSWTGSVAALARVPLAAAVGVPVYDLPDWNDTVGRTQAEVVAKLREAAAISRALPGGEGK